MRCRYFAKDTWLFRTVSRPPPLVTMFTIPVPMSPTVISPSAVRLPPGWLTLPMFTSPMVPEPKETST